MCPDPQILSIYIDGELPSPWKEKMEAHLDTCPKCKERLANYKYMRDLFKDNIDPSARGHIPEMQKRIIAEKDGSETNQTAMLSETMLMEKSKERVWKKLAGRQRYSSAGLIRKSGHIKNGIWQRKLSIPIPLAAAAALLVVFGSMFFTRSINTPNYNYQITEFPNLIEEMPFDFLPANATNDISSVLQYLDTHGSDIIILQLPESRNFSRIGEPEIIKAADFTRINDDTQSRNSSRRRQP